MALGATLLAPQMSMGLGVVDETVFDFFDFTGGVNLASFFWDVLGDLSNGVSKSSDELHRKRTRLTGHWNSSQPSFSHDQPFCSTQPTSADQGLENFTLESSLSDNQFPTPGE